MRINWRRTLDEPLLRGSFSLRMLQEKDKTKMKFKVTLAIAQHNRRSVYT